MLKYILLVQLFLSGVYAHGMRGEHIHFLGSFHTFDFILLIVGLISVYFIFNKLFKRDN